MDFEKHLDSLFPVLAALEHDPAAGIVYDLMSDGLVWSDEQLWLGLTVEQMGCLRALFRYRTSLILSAPDSRFEALWMLAKAKCPQWIGFHPSRCSPSAELLQEYRNLSGK